MTGLRRTNLLPARRIAAMLAVLTIVVAACSPSAGTDMPSYQTKGAAASGDVSTDLTNQTYVPTAQVLAAVAAAQQTQELPEGAAQHLVALSRGETDQDGPEMCFDRRETAAPVSASTFGECAYGDPKGTKQMVVYG